MQRLFPPQGAHRGQVVAYYAWGMDGLVAVVWKVADIAIAVMAAISAIAVPCVAQDGIMAGYVAGEKLTEECTSVVQRDGALCFGYILGVSDAMQAAQASGGAVVFGWRACLPPSTMAKAVRDVAVHFLIAHPEVQQSSASGIVAKALSDAYPCPRR
jgi:hypothetical protein